MEMAGVEVPRVEVTRGHLAGQRVTGPDSGYGCGKGWAVEEVLCCFVG